MRKRGREFVVYPPIDDYELKILNPVEMRVIRIKYQERMKYYEKLENFLGLEKDTLLVKHKKDLTDVITETFIKTFS